MELNFPKIERDILKSWKKNRVFEQSIERRAKARDFVFYEGPPTANARPGIHHVLSRVYKDIICRYKTMRGFRVLRKAGWDTHGLPVELEIEKKLGLKNKKDIEKYGIAKFNKQCKASVWKYKKDWERLTERIAFWLDIQNPYITYENNYIETLWWIIKQIWKKGLLYKDYKVVPYCPRCGTSLSSHEVALGYKKIKEPSIYVKFKIKNEKFQNSHLLVWTTTPWTLPGNVAVAVGDKIDYSFLKVDSIEGAEVSNVKIGDIFIIAKGRIVHIFEGVVHRLEDGKAKYHTFSSNNQKISFSEIKVVRGKDLLGLEYEPLFPAKNLPPNKKAYFVIAGDFVSMGEGTGLVHIAPAFGEEDMEAIKAQNMKNKSQNIPEMPILLTVDEEGKMKTPGYEWSGLFVKEADPLIIDDLKKSGAVFKEELYEHDYPFCWRCSSPLLYYAKESWFIRMTKIKKDLLANNQKINWIPPHLKEGRFGEWLKEVKDWALSRERYWGTPLPVWICKKCGNLEIIGSKNDLLSQGLGNNNYYVLRHGHSLRNQKKIACCWPEKIKCPLTKKGVGEVKKAAKELKKKKIDLIFSSDLLRTKQTAEIVAKETGAEIKFDKNIREINVGIYNGKLLSLAQEAWGQPSGRFTGRLPGGESYNDAKKRMYNFLKAINEKYRGKNILIVSHEAPISLLECAVRGLSDEEIIKYRGGEKTVKTGEWREIKFRQMPYNERAQLDFHRPFIDEVKFHCKKCGGESQRTPEVIDCWFDSGSMPFAQNHYPFVGRKLADQNRRFPADYISEAIDQTRGWFYTLLAVSTLLEFGSPYKNVVSLGHVLDQKGEKMSKSKGNAVDPWQIIEKYGADSVRWYFYTVNQPGDPKLFAEKDIDQVLKKFIMTLWNSYQFFKIYVTRSPIGSGISRSPAGSKNVLDRWIISRLNELIEQATGKLEKYDITSAARAIESFVIDDLSLWYIRRSRRIFQKPLTKRELKESSETLGFVLFNLSKLLAPFIPFVVEEIYRGLGAGRPVSPHLADWPRADKKLIDPSLNKEMEEIRRLVTLALTERAREGIKVRQPLALLKIKRAKIKNEELLNLIKEEVNVKKIDFDDKIEREAELDTKITRELEEEGVLREFIRYMQEMRKQGGYKPKDKILAQCFGEEYLNKILEKNRNFILSETKAKDLILEEKSARPFSVEKDIKINQKNLWMGIAPVKKIIQRTGKGR